MPSVGARAAGSRSLGARRSLTAPADVAVAGAAFCVALAARAEGAYEIRAWGPLGLGALTALLFFSAYGLRVGRAVAGAAAALVALGLWAAASVAWGGVPQVAWSSLDQALLAAAALILGAALAVAGGRGLVLAGVLAAISVQAVEILARSATGHAPSSWFDGRMLDGPVGYHNAQAVLFAVGLPLAVWAACQDRAALRAMGGLAVAPLLGALLLTQSRSAPAAVVAALVLQIWLSRRLRAAVMGLALVAVSALLALELRAVDRSLLTNGLAGSAPALRAYAFAVVVAAVALGAVAVAPAPRLQIRMPRRALAAAVAAAVVAAVVAGTLVATRLGPHVRVLAARLVSDAPPAAAPGATRFASISLDGRREAWRVAVNAVRTSPVTGDGAGRYAVLWGTERRLPTLYILQPHSVELELGSELGMPGIALFLAFLGCASLGLRGGLRADRLAAAAGVGALVVLVAEASVDWTWSFPGLVAPTLLVVGAAAGVADGARSRLFLLVAVGLAMVAFALPYLAAQELARASASVTPAAGLGHVRAALRLDPWSPDAVAAEARLLEGRGEFTRAAARYADAARLSRQPWIEYFAQARALRRSGAVAATTVACIAAQHGDPSEDLLHRYPCEWPWLALHVAGVRPASPEGATRRSAPGT